MIHRLVYRSTWCSNLFAEHKNWIISPSTSEHEKCWKQKPDRRVHRWFIRSQQYARYRFCSSHYGLCCKQHCFHNVTWNPHPSNKTSVTFDLIVSWSVKPRLHHDCFPKQLTQLESSNAVYAMYQNPPNTSLIGCSIKCLRYRETSSNSPLGLPTNQKSWQISHSEHLANSETTYSLARWQFGATSFLHPGASRTLYKLLWPRGIIEGWPIACTKWEKYVEKNNWQHHI